MSSCLERIGDDPVFMAEEAPLGVVDRDFVFRAVNPAYEWATGRATDDLLSTQLFDVFPPNPGDPACDGPTRLRQSFEAVLATGRPHHMVFQRYDIPDPHSPGEFMEKYWIPVSSPVFDAGRLVGVQIRAEDATSVGRRLRMVLTEERDALASDSAAAEVTHLRRALESRATIDQAKGIVMAERGCGAEAAFQVLVGLSQQANIKLRDVAAAIIARAAGTDGRVAS